MSYKAFSMKRACINSILYKVWFSFYKVLYCLYCLGFTEISKSSSSSDSHQLSIILKGFFLTVFSSGGAFSLIVMEGRQYLYNTFVELVIGQWLIANGSSCTVVSSAWLSTLFIGFSFYMKEVTPNSNSSFSLCLCCSNSSDKCVYLVSHSLHFILANARHSSTSFNLSITSLFFISSAYISSSSYCLSLKFSSSQQYSSLILFSFRFTISSNCSIMMFAPSESLSFDSSALFFSSSSFSRSLYKARTFCSRILKLPTSTKRSFSLDLPELIVQTSSLISLSLVSGFMLFSLDLLLSWGFRMVFSEEDIAVFSSRQMISSQTSNFSREECRNFYIQLPPMISVTFSRANQRCYSSQPARDILMDDHICSILSLTYQFYIIFIMAEKIIYCRNQNSKKGVG